MPAAITASAQGGDLAEMRARLQRHIEGSAAGGLAGALERLRLGMRTAARLGPAAADDDPVLDARPRRRPGWARCGPARAGRASAPAAMKRWSAAFDCLAFSASWSSRMRKIICATARRRGSVLAGELAEHGLEILGLAEIAIDRGEADIGDVVELAQMLHHDLADRLRRTSRPRRRFRVRARSPRPSSRPARDRPGACASEICSERTSLSRSNGTRRPLRLITVSSRSCTRSKVVKRKLQAMHTRRRRITAESSVGREVLHLRIETVAAGTAHPACRPLLIDREAVGQRLDPFLDRGFHQRRLAVLRLRHAR